MIEINPAKAAEILSKHGDQLTGYGREVLEKYIKGDSENHESADALRRAACGVIANYL